MQSISIGPFLFAVGVIALLLGVMAAQLVAGFMRRRGYKDIGNTLWWILLASLLVARVAWVIRWSSAYGAHPLSMIDIRDGGFSWIAGLVTLVLLVMLVLWRKPALRTVLPVGAGSGVAVWALVSLVSFQLQAAVHPPMPDMAFSNLEGESVSLSDYRGKPLVINLWATWCGPCRREMPMLVDNSYKLEDVEFLFVDQGEGGEAVRQWLDNEDLAPQHVLLDTSSDLSHHYNVQGYPTTLFVDRHGVLKDTRVGELSEASLHVHLQHIFPLD